MAKPGETLVEASSVTDVQIVRPISGTVAKDSSYHLVAGSPRSIPQDSWRWSQEFGPVKQMIRSIGDAMSSTYSQTLNGPGTQYYLIESGAGIRRRSVGRSR